MNLKPTSLRTALKTLQEGSVSGPNEQPLSSHSFRVCAALGLLEQGEALEMIMLKGGRQSDSIAIKYRTNWVFLFAYSVSKVRLSELSSRNS